MPTGAADAGGARRSARKKGYGIWCDPPYRTSENVIDGLVIIFVDIDNITRAGAWQQAVEQLEAASRGASELMRGALLSQAFLRAAVPNTDGLIVGLNTAAERLMAGREGCGQSIHAGARRVPGPG
jgi:hypothetical protein